MNAQCEDPLAAPACNTAAASWAILLFACSQASHVLAASAGWQRLETATRDAFP